MLSNIKQIYSEIVQNTTKRFRRGICIATLGTLVGAMIFGIVYTNVVEYYEEKQSMQEIEEEIWEQSELQLASKTDGINISFSNIDTDKGIMSLMIKSTDKMADRINNSTSNNPSIEVQPEIIPSDAFITLNAEEEVIKENVKQSSEESSELIKSSNIYFKDAYMAQYMSPSGQFETIIAQYSDDKIYISPRLAFENRIERGFNTEEIDGYTSESKYISDIKYCIISLYGSNKVDNDFEAQELLSKYFTVECGRDLLEQLNGYDNSQVDSVGIGYIAPGKSDLGIEYIDRVYVQVELSVGGKRAYVDLELKLSKQGKIFDIDIL